MRRGESVDNEIYQRLAGTWWSEDGLLHAMGNYLTLPASATSARFCGRRWDRIGHASACWTWAAEADRRRNGSSASDAA